MATNVIYDYGNAVGPGPSYLQAFVGLRIAETSSTGFRLEWNHAVWAMPGSDWEGTTVGYSYWVNGTCVGESSVQLWGSGWYADNGWNNAGWYSWGQSISLGCWSGYTSWSGNRYDSNIDRTYTVPVRQPHGQPTLTASKTTVNYGESITLTAGKSPTQGNAAYNKISWYINGALWLDGAGPGSRTVKPSDKTGAKGGKVTYMVREYHEWYGTYHYTERSVTVTVRGNVVTVYDSSGKKRTGLVTAYDSSGKARNVVVYAYDSSGKLHNTS